MPGLAQRRHILAVTLHKHALESPDTPISPQLLDTQPSDSPYISPASSSGGTCSSCPPSTSSSREAPGNGSNGGADTDALGRLAAATEGFSGSDLVQLCSEAARRPMDEHMQQLEAARRTALRWVTCTRLRRGGWSGEGQRHTSCRWTLAGCTVQCKSWSCWFHCQKLVSLQTCEADNTQHCA